MSITFGGDSGTLIGIKLASGRSIWCHKCVVAHTYEGFMIRTPSERVNEQMLLALRLDAERQFGDWPIHIIEPDRPVEQIDYPRVRVIGFFTSTPMSDEMHLSSLIIAWFQEVQSPLVADDLSDALCAIEWESMAVEYLT